MKNAITDFFSKTEKKYREFVSGSENWLVQTHGRSVYFSAAAVFMLLLLPAAFVTYFTSLDENVINVMMLLFPMLFVGAVGVKNIVKDSLASKILFAYAAWMLVTRLVLSLGGFSGSEFVEKLGVILFSYIVCFNLPRLMESEKNADSFRSAAAGITALFFGALSAVMLAVAIFGFDMPLMGRTLSSLIYIKDGRLAFSVMHSNIIGALMVVGIGMSLFMILCSKKVVSKVVFSLCAVLVACVLFLTDSRTSTVVACVFIGVFAGLVCYDLAKRIGNGSKAVTVAKVAAASAIAVGVFFAMMSLSSTAKEVFADINTEVNKAKAEQTAVVTPSTEETAESTQPTQPAPAQPAVQQTEIVDRGYGNVSEMLSLNNRTPLYEMLIGQLLDSPKMMLLGSLGVNDQPDGYRVTDENGQQLYWSHTHNSFVPVALETGLVGIALVVAFVVIMVIKMAKIFFSSSETYSSTEKFGIVFPAGLLIISLLEPILFSPLPSAVQYYIHAFFILWCGFICLKTDKKKEQAK